MKFKSLSFAIITISFKDLSMSNGKSNGYLESEREREKGLAIYFNLWKLWLLAAIKTCTFRKLLSTAFKFYKLYIEVIESKQWKIKKQYVTAVTAA